MAAPASRASFQEGKVGSVMSKTKSKTRVASAKDDTLSAFERGMDLLYKKKWASAEKIFSGIVAKNHGTTLAERSRRFVDVCVARSADVDGREDSYLVGVSAKNSGDLDTAMECCNRGGLKGRDERFAYLAASVEGLRENHGEAARLLEKAIEMNPANRVHAFHDPDFSSLRDDNGYSELFVVG